MWGTEGLLRDGSGRGDRLSESGLPPSLPKLRELALVAHLLGGGKTEVLGVVGRGKKGVNGP